MLRRQIVGGLSSQEIGGAIAGRYTGAPFPFLGSRREVPHSAVEVRPSGFLMFL